ncbi:MAG TPA: ATP-binding cassette domain-containing protein [Microbacteriaceae bacterium]|nr:ATP-binding cassette domain-containing protein [Microbacteriaceae bacterium]
MKKVAKRLDIKRVVIRSVLLTIPLTIAVLVATGTGGSISRLITVAMINLIIVLGIQVFTGNTGIVSFGHIGFAALGAYLTGILATEPDVKGFRIPDAPFGLSKFSLGPVLGLLVAVLIVTVLAFALGTVISRIGGISATMVTLAVLIIVYTVMNDWVAFSGGAEGFFGIPVTASPVLVFIFAVFVLVIASVYKESIPGLRAQAVREDELAARAMGVSPPRTRLWSWTLSAAIAATGGGLLALFLGSITPRDFYLKLTFATVAMLFVGGVQSVSGAVIGVILITVGNEIFRWLSNGFTIGAITVPQNPGMTDIFLGLVIVVTMISRGSGLMGSREVEDFVIKTKKSTHVDIAESRKTSFISEEIVSKTLRADSLSKSFGGLLAVKSVNLEVETGRVVGLIGPNGSGKSTLLNMLSGVIPPTSGAVLIDSNEVAASSEEASREGIARTFQNIRLFGDLTVAANIQIALDSVGTKRANPVKAEAAVSSIISKLNLTDVLDRKANTLPYGLQRKLEIARAMALMPNFVLLDEPVAGMNEVESAEIADVIKMLAEDLGVGVVVVDHDLPFILNLCSKMFVMESGKLIFSGTPQETRQNEAVIAAYLGSGSN